MSEPQPWIEPTPEEKAKKPTGWVMWSVSATIPRCRQLYRHLKAKAADVVVSLLSACVAFGAEHGGEDGDGAACFRFAGYGNGNVEFDGLLWGEAMFEVNFTSAPFRDNSSSGKRLLGVLNTRDDGNKGFGNKGF